MSAPHSQAASSMASAAISAKPDKFNFNTTSTTSGTPTSALMKRCLSTFGLFNLIARLPKTPLAAGKGM